MIDLLLRFILPAAYQLLPPAMESQAATAMLLAIALQESELEHRRQIGGPARGFWQFERGGGVRGVLTHHATRELMRTVLRRLHYADDMTPSEAHAAIEHNDILASCFARCLLLTDPRPLPFLSEVPIAWSIYNDTWRPGKPRPETWNENYAAAWARTIVTPPGLIA
jgi:hypothetical protein